MSISRSIVTRGLAVIGLTVWLSVPAGAGDTSPAPGPDGSYPTWQYGGDKLECRDVLLCLHYPSGGFICSTVTICSRHW